MPSLTVSQTSPSPDYGRGQEKLWRKLVEQQVRQPPDKARLVDNIWWQAYSDRVVELLTRLGNHVRILFRLSCVPSVQENPASRLNDYFR